MLESYATWLFESNWVIAPLCVVAGVGLCQGFKKGRLEFSLIGVCAALQIAALHVSMPAILMVAPIIVALCLPKPLKEVQLPIVNPTFLLTTVLVLAAATRLYGIESPTISGPNDFGWETGPSYLAARTWDSAVKSGIKQHLISQGFLWHVMYFVMHKWADNPILVGRLFFACTSIMNIFLVFVVGRMLFGNWVGVISCALFAFSPLEPPWARSNYGMTLATCMSLSVASVTFRGARVPQIIVSALTMLSYPAATTMGLFPLVAGVVSRSKHAIFTGLAAVSLWILVPSLVVTITEKSLTWISPLQLHESDRSLFFVANRAPNFGKALTGGLYTNVMSLVNKVGLYSKGDQYFVLSALTPKYLLGRVVLIFLPAGLYLIRETRMGMLVLVWLSLFLVTAFTSLDVIPRRFCTFVAPVSIISGYGAAVAVA